MAPLWQAWPIHRTADVYATSRRGAATLRFVCNLHRPFFHVGDRYSALYAKMLALLERLNSKELDCCQERRDAVDVPPVHHIHAIENWLRRMEVERLRKQ